MKKVERNFDDENTFITEYRIKDYQTKNAKIIVKTATGDYYETPCTKEDLEIIRCRMKQEYFDGAHYKIDLIINIVDCIRNFFFGATFCAALTIFNLYILSICIGIIPFGYILKKSFHIIKNIIEIKKTSPKFDELEERIGISYNVDLEEKTNIVFKRNFGCILSSATLKERTGFLPDNLDELEYTILEQILESEVDWNNLPNVCELKHVRSKRRTKKEPQIEQKNISKDNNLNSNSDRHFCENTDTRMYDSNFNNEELEGTEPMTRKRKF